MNIKRILFAGPWKALMLALAIGLVFGVGQVGEPLENVLQIARNKLRSHPASGNIVLVAIDEKSIREVGDAPWTAGQLAQIVGKADADGARRIHLEADLEAPAPPGEAATLERTLDRARAQILLPARFAVNKVSGDRSDQVAPARFARHARLVNTNIYVWWDNAVWRHPYGAPVANRAVPSLASVLGGRDSVRTGLFPIDYAVDVRTIPIVSASDVLADRTPARQLRGKDVVIAATDPASERYRAPGTGLVPGILFSIAAAETLLAGAPIDLGWIVPFAVAALIAGAALYVRRRWVAAALLAVGIAGQIAVPLLLEIYHVHGQVLPALAVLLTACAARSIASVRRAFHVRGTTNLITGLPNLQALRQSAVDGGVVVAARIKNYAQITATLAPPHEKELVEQIVGRLEFGSGGATIHQADEGVFVWLASIGQEEGIVQQLEGLQALFRSPIVVGGRIIDLAITFGIDLDGSRPVMQRASSALVAADDAARDGKRWARFNPASVEDADWTMSLLARLDHAIDNNELWVAYQIKVDCQTGAPIGAEALVRWTHPEKGEVYPDQFIGAAEAGGRIERLSYYVLDTALAAAASLNRHGGRFTIAVNLSVLLLNSEALVPTVSDLLRKHGVKPGLLTLEVTETSTLGSAADQIANLERLSSLGVQLSIDDYGTGFSTLEYLRRIPASEIKIDRSFIGMLDKSQSDRIMVNSTIQLAHSLGRKVVAEGVENEDILDELRRMGCDIAQGYHISRALPFADLCSRLGRKGTEQAA